jgi:hypothetical protein
MCPASLFSRFSANPSFFNREPLPYWYLKRLIFILLQAMYFVPSRAQVAPDTVMMLRDLKALRETGKGRLTGSRDNRMAQFYILGRLRDEGVAGCWGTYEQPFFFERGGKRIMGTNLTACIGGRSSRPICMAASYGTDDSMEFPGQPAAAAILLGVAGYFRRKPLLHTLIIAFTDGMPGASLFPGTTRDPLALVTLACVAGQSDSLLYGFPASAGNPVAGMVRALVKDRGMKPVPEPDTNHSTYPLFDLRLSEAPGPVESGTRDLGKATWLAIHFITRLDSLMSLGIRLPPGSRWIMDRDSVK